ncbi:MAG: hypothetical protein IKJ11_09190 [Clostridia bacterium]|nr:hypothetical protein [Clostridia bacterium]
MKNKKMVWLIALVFAIAVASAAVFAATRPVSDGPDGKMTEYTAPDDGVRTDADEENVIEVVELTGTITEITDEYVLLDAGEMGMIQANLSDDTMLEGVDDLAVGQVAVIFYDGKMTRSIPAQITALKIGVYEVKGTVTGLADDRVTITKNEGGDEVVLTLPENAPQIAVGDVITAYTTGVSTMSLPPQMNAIAIVK